VGKELKFVFHSVCPAKPKRFMSKAGLANAVQHILTKGPAPGSTRNLPRFWLTQFGIDIV
jgi:hypothetical protein